METNVHVTMLWAAMGVLNLVLFFDGLTTDPWYLTAIAGGVATMSYAIVKERM